MKKFGLVQPQHHQKHVQQFMRQGDLDFQDFRHSFYKSVENGHSHIYSVNLLYNYNFHKDTERKILCLHTMK